MAPASVGGDEQSERKATDEYTVVYGESVSGTVSAGAIAVCNAGGCLDVAHGQSYFVKDENTKPVFISQPALLLPRQPVIADERNRDKVADGKKTDTKSSEKAEASSSTDSYDSEHKHSDQHNGAIAPQQGASEVLTQLQLEGSSNRLDNALDHANQMHNLGGSSHTER